MWNQVHMISKYAEKVNMLAQQRQFTEMFPFEANHRSEKLELTKENEYDFRNQHPKKSLYLADPKNCFGQCNRFLCNVLFFELSILWLLIYLNMIYLNMVYLKWCISKKKNETFLWSIPVNIYLFKVNNRNIRKKCEIFSKLTTKTPERRHWRRCSVFIANFENISHSL